MSTKRIVSAIGIVLLLVCIEVGAQTKQQATSKEKKKQTTDSSMQYAIPPIFDAASDFHEGLAAVRIDDKWGFIDKTGKVVIEPQFNELQHEFYAEFSEGLVAVNFEKAKFAKSSRPEEETFKWGFVNKQGKIVIDPKFWAEIRKPPLFSEGFAAVILEVKNPHYVHISTDYGTKYGFIDKTGNIVIEAKYDKAENFSNGIAKVKIDGKWGFIDKTGTVVIPLRYDEIEDFNNGLARAKINEEWGFIDIAGNEVIPFAFSSLTDFIDGIAVAEKNGKQFFINKTGNRISNKEFSSLSAFNDGLACFEEEEKYGYINEKQEIVFEVNRVKNSKDKESRRFADWLFESFYGCKNKSFSNGLALRPYSEEKTDYDPKQRFGYTNKKGKFVINPIFSYASRFENGFAQVGQQGKGYFLINKSGDRVSAYFSEIFSGSEGLALVKNNDKYGFIRDPAHDSSDSAKKPHAKLNLTVSATKPVSDGSFTISVHTNTDTSSLKVNDEEYGGRKNGSYKIKKVARIGQDTDFVITAIDVDGNSDSKTISVSRQLAPNNPNQIASLKPENLKFAPKRDAVAIIIGIQNYKRVPKAEFSASDAKEFYEYAVRSLGVRQEKIKILLDEDADDVNIIKAFQNWLPLQVNKDKTDVYVFFSGHGLPSSDGKSLYFLPHGVDKELLSRTAVGQADVINALASSKPKTVTMFIDACYSGQTRSGDVLVADARPLALKNETISLPDNFAILTASANDQISSSSRELKHGIFSFYLMKGMEGEADINKDGKITLGEMHEYLSDKVSRQAMALNRQQTTQLTGDGGRVLLAR